MYALLLTVGLLTQPSHPMDKSERDVNAAIVEAVGTQQVDVYIGEENPIASSVTFQRTRKIGQTMWLEFRDSSDAWMVPMSEVKAVRVRNNQPKK